MAELIAPVDFGVGPYTGPVRTCVGCRREDLNNALVRLAVGPSGVVVDSQRRMPGRGAYLHPRSGCVDQAVQRGAVPRALRMQAQTDTKAPAWAIAVLQLGTPVGTSDKESSGDEHTMSAPA